jgi:hypothetical protein
LHTIDWSWAFGNMEAATMEFVERFLAWATAFEETYRDDDWTRLEPFLAPDVVYEIKGAPFACVIHGRAEMLAAIRRSVSGFDRHCVRRIMPSAMPKQEGDSVVVRGTVGYVRGDSPELLATVTETATYANGLIVRLVDVYDADMVARGTAWFAAWGAGLDWSYM